MSDFHQVIDGVLHWKAFHDRIRQDAHSYYLPAQKLAIDPMPSDGLLEALAEHGGVEKVVLTNRHHLRGSEQIAEVFGCGVWAPASGMHEFEQDQPVHPYEWGDQLAPGITAHPIAAICPDDGALHIEVGPGALALADAVIGWEGELAFVPDFLMDEPDRVKPETTAALEKLLHLEFDAILLAHGAPIPTGGKETLRDFIANPTQASFDG
ncbi:MAG TPA: hypothetical protein VKA36_05200 [Solirubrobacterales bacterium]|nr:hypothetical protein [Solirubrobacterales bacterium]